MKAEGVFPLRAPEEEAKPPSMTSVKSFGNLPLNFVLYVDYNQTNSGQC